MSIDAYLRQLRALLPATRRERFLREAEAHLRDSAGVLETGGLDRQAAEARATAEFGPPRDIAARVRRETAPVAVGRAGGIALLAVAALLVPLYGIPENQLPPAPWSTRPAHLTVLLAVTFGLWLTGVAVVALGMVATRFASVRLSGRLVVTGVALACGAAVAGVVTTIAWRLEAPETPVGTLLAMIVPTSAVALAMAVGAAVWTRERVRG